MTQPTKATVVGIEHHLNLVPATVQCDECGHQEKCGNKWMDQEQKDRVASHLRQAGWLVEGNHERHVCPDCRAKT